MIRPSVLRHEHFLIPEVHRPFIVDSLSLSSVLLRPDKYDQPGALTFKYESIFSAMGPGKFEYTLTAVKDTILSEFEKNDFGGLSRTELYLCDL